MARTPRQETITLTPNQRRPMPISGRWLMIISNTVATVDVAFDNDAFTPMLAGIPYPATDGQFEQVLFQDTLGAGCTIVALFSDDQAPDMRGGPLAAAIAASLANIEQEIIGGPTTLQLPNLLLPATPGPGLQIFAANAAGKETELFAPETNGGFVYLGITAARCTGVDSFWVLYPGGGWWSEREKGAIFGCGSDAVENVKGRQC
jgi:hypothetical protein